MSRRRLIPLIALAVSLTGVAWVGLRYVGLADTLPGGAIVVHADFSESGGIFPNAPVTYRGVPVGRVDRLVLRTGGVRLELRLDADARVPADARAVVANRSALGEQYVDLRPDRADGPYLVDGSTIPRNRTRTPLAAEVLLEGVDELVNSVDRRDLAVVLDELGQALEGSGPSLATLLDGQHKLLAAAETDLPATVAMLRDARTALNSQVASRDAIRTWARSLAALSAELRGSGADAGQLLTAGTRAADETTALVSALRPTTGFLLGNLLVAGQVQARRVDGLEQILATYPAVVAQGMTVLPGDGTAHLGVVLNAGDPPPCAYAPGERSCGDAALAGGSGVRSDRRAPRPRGTDPVPPGPVGSPPDREPAGGVLGRQPGVASFAGFDPETGVAVGPDGLPLLLGSTGGQRSVVGDQSWKALLIGPLTA